MSKPPLSLADKLPTRFFASKLKNLALSLPASLLKPLTLMPTSLSEQIMTTALNRAFSVALEEDDLDFLRDNWLQLTIYDANFCCYISVVETPDDKVKIQVVNALPSTCSKANVEFSADTVSLVLLASKQVDPDTLFFQRKLLVTGDTELGLSIKNFLDDFDINESFPPPITSAANKVHAIFRSER